MQEYITANLNPDNIKVVNIHIVIANDAGQKTDIKKPRSGRGLIWIAVRFIFRSVS
jgi:hypothetical protein